MRYPRMSPRKRVAALAASMDETGEGHMRYPAWYMRHRHFLPGGYLSSRSAGLYERLVAPLYNLPSPGWVRWQVAGAVAKASPKHILELGCGTGRLLQAMRRQRPESSVAGVELSPFLLDAARTSLAGDANEIALHHADAASFAAGSRYDAIVAVHLLGHVPIDHARAVFANAVANLLAPGGILHVVEHRWHAPQWATGEAGSALLTPLLVHRTYVSPTA